MLLPNELAKKLNTIELMLVTAKSALTEILIEHRKAAADVYIKGELPTEAEPPLVEPHFDENGHPVWPS